MEATDVMDEVTGAARAKRIVATAAVALGMMISAFEGTVVTTAMPHITQELGGRVLYAWVFTGFLLASTLAVLLVGKLSDQLGRLPVFLGGLALFLGGSAACGLAQSVPQLIAFRVIQGLGAGAIQPTTMTITADLFTLEERAAVQSIFTGAWGLANVTGPVIGGWMVDHGSWRWVFLVNVPVGLLTALLLVLSYRDPPRAKTAEADYVGPLLGGVAAALVLLALSPLAGTVIRAAAALGAGAAGWAFVRGQKQSRSPVLAPVYLRDPNVLAGLVGGLFAGALVYATSAYVPLWMTSRGENAITAGLALVPLLGAWALGSAVGVKILIRGGMRASVGGGFALAGMGSLLLAGVALSSGSIAAAFASLAVFGLGLGPAASTSTIAPQSVVPWNARGAVTCAIYAARGLGGATAIALIDLAQGHPVWQVALLAPFACTAGALLLSRAPAAPQAVARDALVAE